MWSPSDAAYDPNCTSRANGSRVTYERWAHLESLRAFDSVARGSRREGHGIDSFMSDDSFECARDAAKRLEELEDELERLRHYFSHSEEGIFCFELQPPVSMHIPRDDAITLWLECAKLVECNDAFTRMYGFDHADELIGTPLNPFLSDNAEHNREYLRSFWDSGLRLKDGESHETDRFGNPKFFLNTLVGVIDQDQLVRVWGTQRDITHLRLLEKQRLDTQRVQAVEELAAGIAHHFNNMLTIISGNLNLTLESASLDRADSEALQSAARAADHAAGLTRQLLTFSQKHQQHSEPVDVRTIVMTVCQLLRPTLGQQMSIDLDLSEAPRVRADPALIQSLIVRLVDHARRALNDAGTVRIQLHGLAQDGDAAELVLRMSYPARRGSSLAGHSGAFDLFFSGAAAEDPHMAGLTEVYGAVRNLGGSFRSETDRQLVTITLQIPADPIAPAPAGASKDRATKDALATVLVVEDDPDVLSTVQRFLLASGYRVLTAQNVSDGHAVLERHASAVDVLIADIILPDKSGLDFALELRNTRPEIQILLMSGRGTPSGEPGTPAPFESLDKPFSRDDLAARVAKLLESRKRH